MKKIIIIPIALTIVGFIPVIHQEFSGCSAFGYEHLVSSSVITTADSCNTSILAFTLIPSVQLSRIIHFDSVYLNYFFLAIFSFVFYVSLVKIILLMSNKRSKR